MAMSCMTKVASSNTGQTDRLFNNDWEQVESRLEKATVPQPRKDPSQTKCQNKMKPYKD